MKKNLIKLIKKYTIRREYGLLHFFNQTILFFILQSKTKQDYIMSTNFIYKITRHVIPLELLIETKVEKAVALIKIQDEEYYNLLYNKFVTIDSMQLVKDLHCTAWWPLERTPLLSLHAKMILYDQAMNHTKIEPEILVKINEIVNKTLKEIPSSLLWRLGINRCIWLDTECQLFYSNIARARDIILEDVYLECVQNKYNSSYLDLFKQSWKYQLGKVIREEQREEIEKEDREEREKEWDRMGIIMGPRGVQGKNMVGQRPCMHWSLEPFIGMDKCVVYSFFDTHDKEIVKLSEIPRLLQRCGINIVEHLEKQNDKCLNELGNYLKERFQHNLIHNSDVPSAPEIIH